MGRDFRAVFGAGRGHTDARHQAARSNEGFCDAAKLQLAFRALRKQGVAARLFASDAAYRRFAPEGDYAFVRNTRQVFRRTNNIGERALYVSFSSVSVARVVVDCLHGAGLWAEWDGTPRHRRSRSQCPALTGRDPSVRSCPASCRPPTPSALAIRLHGNYQA